MLSIKIEHYNHFTYLYRDIFGFFQIFLSFPRALLGKREGVNAAINLGLSRQSAKILALVAHFLPFLELQRFYSLNRQMSGFQDKVGRSPPD